MSAVKKKLLFPNVHLLNRFKMQSGGHHSSRPLLYLTISLVKSGWPLYLVARIDDEHFYDEVDEMTKLNVTHWAKIEVPL